MYDLLNAIIAPVALVISLFSLLLHYLRYKTSKKDSERNQILESTAYMTRMLDVLKNSATRLKSRSNGDLNTLNLITSEDDFRSANGTLKILKKIQRRPWGLKRVINNYFDAEKKLKECIKRGAINKEDSSIVQEKAKDTLQKIDKLIKIFEKNTEKNCEKYRLTEDEISKASKQIFGR